MTGLASAPVVVVTGVSRWTQIRKFPGNGTVYFNWGGASGATNVRVFRGPSPNGPFIDVQGTKYFGDEAQVPGNPLDVAQYFKIQAIYSTGTAESVVVQVTAKSGGGGTCIGTISPTGAVTWQNYYC